MSLRSPRFLRRAAITIVVAATATAVLAAASLATSAPLPASAQAEPVTPVLANVGVPLAARLLAEPYQTTGVRVAMTGFGNLRGLANDGTNVYALNASGSIMSVPLSSIDMTPGGSVTVSGTMHTVGWGQNGAPSMPNLSQLSLAYSHGCLFITDDNNSVGSIRLYCIDTSTWSVTELAVPSSSPLPAGYYYVRSSLIDFPDGRVGKVSAYSAASGGGYETVLRLYTVNGTGAAATITWSEDLVMTDPDYWATDEHGIATDGTYLYRIQWNSFVPNTKVWALQSGAPAPVFASSQYTMPYGNMHFLSHDHTANTYLVGYWDQPNFFITTSADPGPGPGRPLTPTFGTPTPTADGYTVQITNYDAAFTWGGSATAGGSVTVSNTGLVTVTGVAPSTASTATITTTRSGYPGGSAPVTATSNAAPPTTTTTTTTAPPTTTTTTTTAPPTTTSTTAVPSTTTTSAAPAPTATTTTAPSAAPVPTRLDDGTLPDISPGKAVTITDGVAQAIAVAPNATENGVVVSGDGFTMAIAGTDEAGTKLPLNSSGNLLLQQGQFAEVNGSGFAPGTPVDVWAFSTPTYLGRLTVLDDGTFRGRLPIPASLATGGHTLQANGTSATGAARSVSLGVEVVSATTTPDQLAFSGSSHRTTLTMVVAFVLVGGALLLTRRRRRA